MSPINQWVQWYNIGKQACGQCPDITDQTGRSRVNLGGENSVEAAGANNVMAQFYTIAEFGPPELFGKQFGI